MFKIVHSCPELFKVIHSSRQGRRFSRQYICTVYYAVHSCPELFKVVPSYREMLEAVHMQCIVVHGVVQPLRCCSGLKASSELSGLCFWSLKLTIGAVMNYLAIDFDFGLASGESFIDTQ